jgi:FAD synthetase
MDVYFRYNLELKKVPGPIKHALGVILAEKPELKAVLMGTRRTDPYSAMMNSFQVQYLICFQLCVCSDNLNKY